jgi:uncharacterized membrane protein
MIIMALDHTRDFFHIDAYIHDPLDVTTTTVPLFFTRWITHFCAPIFVFLAGTSIYLQSFRKSGDELSSFLFKRGIWLIVVEVLIITLGITFDLSYSFFILQVIWAIGISMVIMALIIRLPFQVILASGILIVAGHNIFDFFQSSQGDFLTDLLRNGNFAFYPIGGGRSVIIVYPFVPWLGLMMLGYCFGKFYEPSFDAALRKKLIIRVGMGLILLFVLLRLINIYGDPFPWSRQDSPVFTILSFFNAHKYPPSLLYICMTIGPALLFLAVFENATGKVIRSISIYGRVPFFYYVVHFYVIHALATVFFLIRGHSLAEQIPGDQATPFKFVVAGEGYSLIIVYVVWALIVLSLYPLCQWFSEFKKRRNSIWLSYV